MGANVVASIPVACQNAAGACFSSFGGSLCHDAPVPSKSAIASSQSSASSASSVSSVNAASSASVASASAAAAAASSNGNTGPTSTSAGKTSESSGASSAAVVVASPVAIIQRVPLDPDYPITFLAGNTFNFGADATVAGNIGLGAPAAAYGGTGIGALVLDPSGQFCE